MNGDNFCAASAPSMRKPSHDAIRIFSRNIKQARLDPVEYLEFALGTLSQFSRNELDAMHQEFMQDVIRPAILPEAHEIIQQHQDADHLVAIITATNRFVTAPIAHALGIEHLMAAEPALDETGRPTGKLIGTPSSGQGKVTHLQNWLQQQGKHLDDFPQSFFYSDSHNDLPLLSLVTHPVAANPNSKLEAHARRAGWPIIHLFEPQ